MKPDYEKLFEMRDPLATLPWRLGIRDMRFQTPAFHGWILVLFRGSSDALPPLGLFAATGGRPADVMWSRYPPIFVVSDRVIDLLAGNGLTGWSTYAVEVRDKKGELVPGYRGFAVTGRAGDHDLHRVFVVQKPVWKGSDRLREVLRGIYLEDDSWDSSDFSLMGETSNIIVTEQVVRAFKKAKIRNVQFTRLPEVEIPASVYESFGLWPLK